MFVSRAHGFILPEYVEYKCPTILVCNVVLICQLFELDVSCENVICLKDINEHTHINTLPSKRISGTLFVCLILTIFNEGAYVAFKYVNLLQCPQFDCEIMFETVLIKSKIVYRQQYHITFDLIL